MDLNFVKRIPKVEQIAPVYAILAEDLDNDGIKDIFLAGNLFGVKPEIGLMDANMGVLLKGDSISQFKYIPPALSGLFYKGEARDILSIKTGNKKKAIILSRNNSSLKIFK